MRFQAHIGSMAVTQGVCTWRFDEAFPTTFLGAVALTYGTNSGTLVGIKVSSYSASSVTFLINQVVSGSSAIEPFNGNINLYAIAYGT